MDGLQAAAFEGSYSAYSFGPFRLDLNAGMLFREGQVQPLAPKVFDALRYLVERPGCLVSKDELLKALWPDAFVAESNLTQTIFLLRKALGESGTEPRYIATVPGRGYRFVAEVQEISRSAPRTEPGQHAAAKSAGGADSLSTSSTSPQPMAPESLPARLPAAERLTKQRNLLVIAALAGVGAVALLALTLLPLLRSGKLGKTTAAPEPPIRSLAVLPLKDLSSDPGQEYFAEGITEELITRLAAIEGLRVISYASVVRYQETRKSVAQIASELQVDSIITGTITRNQDRVRITLQLMRGANGQHLWAESYERDLREVLDLQSEIARDLAWNISLKVNVAGQTRLANRHAVPPEALQLYLRGRYDWRTRRPPDLRDAIVEFQQAIAIKPDFAQAYAGLADCYVVLPLLSTRDPASELYPKARQAAEKALALDPTLAEVHTSAAYTRMYHDWDFAGAEQEFQHALRLDPNYATAHQWYAELLALEGRRQEASAEIQKAEQLDPYAAIVFLEAGQVHRQAREYEQAIADYKKALALDPHMYGNYYWMSDVYFRMGMVHASAEALRASFGWQPAEEYARNSQGIAELEAAYYRDGWKGWTSKRMQRIRQMADRPSYPLALGYASLGNDAKAFEYLNRAYATHDADLLTINVDPEWDRLRSDPRFTAIVTKIGLPRTTLQQAALRQ